MSGRVVFAASDLETSEGIERAITSGASALGAAFAGYLMAAAVRPGVLLSPLSILLSGFGARRAFDGRCCQPGLEQRRPRGFLSAAEVTQAACVAVPTGLTALYVALSYDENSARSAAVRFAMSHAKRSGAKERASLFEILGKVGAGLWTHPEVRRPLLAAAGPLATGSLTPSDLATISELDLEPRLEAGELMLPWPSDDTSFPGEIHSILTQDARGTAVGLSYGVVSTGLAIEPLELLAPLVAQPVMRGQKRVRPGTRLSFPANLRIGQGADGPVVSSITPSETLRLDAAGLRK